MFIEIFNED